MFRINEEQFYYCLEQFKSKASAKQEEKYNTTELSFSKGFLREQEWYKYQIFDKAQDVLDISSWTEADIGSGIIADKIRKVFHLEADGFQQNIVDWREIERTEDIIGENLKKSEALFFEMFCEDNDKKTFKSAVTLFGHRYSAITYLFFVKDCKQYVPVKPQHFKNRFDTLGIATSSMSSCTWENYQEFLEIIRWVRDAIAPSFSNVTLLDAHSFIWMIWILDHDNNSKTGIAKVVESENSLPIGSPKWFHEQSKTQRLLEINAMIERRRASFIERFSPEQLSLMTGEELLHQVFGDAPDSMMRLLMFDGDYRWFGAAGKYKYLGVVYQGSGPEWVYKEGSVSQTISRSEAEKKAENIRNGIITCVNAIENVGIFQTIKDYQTFKKQIEGVFFYKYPWMMKYYQMLYPQFFPGMYADSTLNRALHILGLPKHGSSERLLKAGEISLFIRKCDVNNIVFNQIYADEWGWEKEFPPCENASENHKESSKPIKNVNTIFYKTPSSNESRRQERINKAEIIEREINSLHVEGKEKEAVVKVRINQGEFRNRLLKKYGKCCLCGVSNPTLLRASHIKPWCVSEPDEKLDENNGLLLCPNHDLLFDSGLISFEDSGIIMISDKLSKYDQMLMNIQDNMRIKSVSEKQHRYLGYHRKYVYKTISKCD